MLRLAIELQAIHVDPGRIVALYFEKFVWAKVAMSGVLRAGAALIHINPEHPPARQRDVLTETAARIIICSERTHIQVSSQYLESMCLMVDRKLFAQEPDHKQVALPNPTNLRPNNAAYVICTSGSTGTPQIIMLNMHRFA